MSKFSSTPRPNPTAPITTATTSVKILTHEGAPAHSLDPKSELFLLAVTNMVAESTFYEAAADRDNRFIRLIHNVTAADPEWMAEFIPWLRHSANMRSAPIVALAEYVKAGGPNARPLIAATLSRPDEPAELLAYWHQFHGRKLPAALKRGIADACVKLYNERSALRYDGQSRGYRMGDVIELTHPKPRDAWQSQLFRYLVGRTHGDDMTVDQVSSLDKILTRHQLENIPTESRRQALRNGEVDIASWEWLSGWLPGGMDAEAWEAAIPQMGYMALLRNLRNFDNAGISESMVDTVIARLTDPESVAQSRQFPYRFWSAYKAAPSLNYARSLEKALDMSTRNIPELGGRTLVLTDTSGSMQSTVSDRSTVMLYEIAAIFAAAMARACESVDLFSWASTHSRIPMTTGSSVLKTVEIVKNIIGRDGMGTMLSQALTEFNGHDRIVIFSDMQLMDGSGRLHYTGFGRERSGSNVRDLIPRHVPIHVYDLAGYGRSPMQVSPQSNVYLSGGFSDAAFRMLPLLERESATWPWEQA